MNILLKVQYDGTNFLGWQIQREGRTVQGELEKALAKLFKQDIKIRGASRTDTGVHAFSQLAFFKHETKIPIEKLPMAINSMLEKDLVVTKAELVNEDFHPQNSVYKKTYQYKIYNALVFNPIFRNYTSFVYGNLDISKMEEACKYFIGEHDFSAFCSAKSSAKTTIRKIYELSIKKEDELITIEVTGNGFLYNMVRIIVGTLIDVGKLKIKPCEVKNIILSKNREMAGKTVEAKGLLLYKIFYTK